MVVAYTVRIKVPLTRDPSRILLEERSSFSADFPGKVSFGQIVPQQVQKGARQSSSNS